MKRVGNLWKDVCSFSQLHTSCKLAQKGSKLNDDIATFLMEKERHLLQISEELKGNTYEFGDFRVFHIADPKPRVIKAAPFRDRVVHHSLCMSLSPHFERSYIGNSFACRKGKGNRRALQKAQKYVKKYKYCLKFDILHFFESMSHSVLMGFLKRKIKDSQVLGLCQRIIEHGGDSEGRGVPIGNLTSQHFANFYLNALDQFCVHQLRVPAIIRYMDDVLIFSDSRDFLCQDILQEITLFLAEDLELQLKHHITKIQPCFSGVSFLGFCIYPTHIHFDRARKKRFRQTWKAIGEDQEDAQQCRSSALISWASMANTLHFRQSIFDKTMALQ